MTEKTCYVVGWNMPGYLPEMEPYAFDTMDEAKRSLIEDMLRHADQAADGSDEDLAEALTHNAEDVNLWITPQSMIVGNTSYWIVQNDCTADFYNSED